MTALIFLLVGVAMMTAVAGRRDIAVSLFFLCLVASVVWLGHHMTSALTLSL
jgi:Family of unknown function (DUF5993)